MDKPDAFPSSLLRHRNKLIRRPVRVDRVAEVSVGVPIAGDHAADHGQNRLQVDAVCAAEETLRRHDWLYRWKDILAMAGLKPRPQMEAREMRLGELAALAKEYAAVAGPA